MVPPDVPEPWRMLAFHDNNVVVNRQRRVAEAAVQPAGELRVMLEKIARIIRSTAVLTTMSRRQNTPRENAGPVITAHSGGAGHAPRPASRGAHNSSRVSSDSKQMYNIRSSQSEQKTHKKQNQRSVAQAMQTADVMASVVTPAWIAAHTRPQDHASSTYNLTTQMPDANSRRLKKDKSIFERPVTINSSTQSQWPMDSSEPPPFPPPWPSRAHRAAMCAESASTDPEGPLGPLATNWVNSLVEWYDKLQRHFGFNESDLAANVREKADKWSARLQFMKPDQPEKFKFIMDFIRYGHVIPFNKVPQKHFRKRNPPSLTADKERAWKAIRGDIAHGAITPVNIEIDGLPWCVCPVRTADKSDGSARFVHNTRHVNACVDDGNTKCKLETLLRTRNMFMPNGFLVGSDYKSGYHCVFIHPDFQKYLAFALHISELTDDAIAWLKREFPHAYYHN